MAERKSDFGDINLIDCNKVKVRPRGSYQRFIFPKSTHDTMTLSLDRKIKQRHKKKKKKQLFMQRSVR